LGQNSKLKVQKAKSKKQKVKTVAEGFIRQIENYRDRP
jgi:hypothetical protein